MDGKEAIISDFTKYRDFRRQFDEIPEPAEVCLVFSKNNITGRGILEVVNLTNNQQGEIYIEPTYPRLVNVCHDSQVIQFPASFKRYSSR